MKYYVLLGDLNSDAKTVNGQKLNDLCLSQNMTCLINEATRITKDSQTCLDQILVNMPNFVKRSWISPPVSTNDHCTINVELRFKIPYDKAYSRHIWLYKDGDFVKFRQSLCNVNWDDCFESTDVDIVCTKWTEIFLNIARTCIPNKVVLVRPRDVPWFNNHLRRLKRKVHRFYNLAKKSSSVHRWDRYKEIRDIYKHCLDDAKEKYDEQLANSLATSSSSKKWWSTVKSILGRGNDESYPPLEMNNDNVYIVDNKEKAEHFNDYFLSHNRVDSQHVQLPEFEPLIDESLEIITISEADVLDQIMSLELNKATGHDGISARMLKEAGHAIVPSITKLINLSLETCKFPESWKKANVIPIHKKGDTCKVSNYRPISVLPVISKIAERIVFKYVYNFFHVNNVISRNQSGFQPNDSTVNQLAFMYHEFCKALDQKKDVRIVFCDVSKAFDKVWHAGVIHKLKQNGIHGSLLNWFKNYLDKRHQRIVIKGQCSKWGQIEAGVPQGSVLGPLLFLIYINDLVDVVDCGIKMFADDTCLYINVDNANVLENSVQAANDMNRNLRQVFEWSKKWLVTFNESKTKSMVITNKNAFHPDIYFNDTVLENVQKHKHLGVIVNKRLDWSDHINAILSNASKMLDVTRKLKYRLDRATIDTIYLSFIRPKLEYACQIWDDCYDRDANKLESFQLSAARVVTGAKKAHLIKNFMMR